MSYAAVAAENAPPVSQQPRPDPALLNITHPTHSDITDDARKVNVVGPDSKEHPRTTISETAKIDNSTEIPATSKGDEFKKGLDELEEEGQNVWETAKYYLFRPGVAGGLIGIRTKDHFSSQKWI